MKFLVHVPGAKDGHRFFLNEQKFLKNLLFFTEKNNFIERTILLNNRSERKQTKQMENER